jgi:hypothetical protein
MVFKWERKRRAVSPRGRSPVLGAQSNPSSIKRGGLVGLCSMRRSVARDDRDHRGDQFPKQRGARALTLFSRGSGALVARVIGSEAYLLRALGRGGACAAGRAPREKRAQEPSCPSSAASQPTGTPSSRASRMRVAASMPLRALALLVASDRSGVYAERLSRARALVMPARSRAYVSRAGNVASSGSSGAVRFFFGMGWIVCLCGN